MTSELGSTTLILMDKFVQGHQSRRLPFRGTRLRGRYSGRDHCRSSEHSNRSRPYPVFIDSIRFIVNGLYKNVSTMILVIFRDRKPEINH